MVHVPNCTDGLDWYEKAFPDSIRLMEKNRFEYLAIGDATLEIVPSDDKIRSGTAGTVVYWHTNDFEKRLEYLLSIGATLFRGPLLLDHGLKMCQVLDPFGNAFGIRCCT